MSIYTYMYKGNVQQKNPLCAASCVTKNISPRYAHIMYSRRLCAKNAVFEIVYEESVKDYNLHIHVQWEHSAEPSMRRILCHSGTSHLSPFSPAFFHRDAVSLFG